VVDAAAVAGEILRVELESLAAPALAPSSAARDWASSGAMALTASAAGGAPRLAPGGPAAWMRAAAAMAGLDAVVADPAALLGERAACAGLGPNGPRSVGGAFRAVLCADGRWLGLSLAREFDRHVLPALISGAVDGDEWEAVARWAHGHSAATAEQRAILLGLAAGVVATHPPATSRGGVRVEIGSRRAAPRDRLLVVDFSALWAGPLCAHLLGLLGARVIKIESTRRPDGARQGERTFYDLLHAGHESVAVDFDTAAGRAALADLVAAADVVIEASRPRALERLGLAAREHAESGTVWVSITAYGRDEPARVGFGDDVAASAGLTVDDGAGPYPAGDAIADPLSGMTAAAAAVAALRAGHGCLLDVSMRDVAARAASLPGDDARVVRRDDAWWVEVGDETVAVAPPRARRAAAQAAALGAHTSQVLAELGL
jgi:hypothetical protein